jgi:hypothetical protein
MQVAAPLCQGSQAGEGDGSMHVTTAMDSLTKKTLDASKAVAAWRLLASCASPRYVWRCTMMLHPSTCTHQESMGSADRSTAQL